MACNIDLLHNESDPCRPCGCIIENLLEIGGKFTIKTYTEKTNIIKNGRPKPVLHNLTAKTKNCERKFSVCQYDKTSWMTGCAKVSRIRNFRKFFVGPVYCSIGN